MNFRTQFSYVLDEFEHNDQPSITVPDEALSVHQLLHQYSIGAPISANYNPEDGYPSREPDFDDIDFSTMDRFEIEQMRMDNAEDIKYHEDLLKSYEARKAEIDKKTLEYDKQKLANERRRESVTEKD